MKHAYLATLAAGLAATAPTGADLAMRDPARAAAFGLVGQSTFGGDFDSRFAGDLFSPGWEGEDTAARVGDSNFARQQLSRGDDRMIDVNMHAFRNALAQRQRLHSALGQERGALGQERGDLDRETGMYHGEVSYADELRRLERRMAERLYRTNERRRLIDPNEGSGIDVGRLIFPVSYTITLLGTAQTFTNFFGQPDTTIKPERITFNAPCYGFVLINDVKVKNVSAVIGGTTDAGFFSGTSVGMHVSFPKLTPSNKLTIYGSYTGTVPTGYPIGSYTFVAQVIGPALVTGSDRIEDD